VQVIRLQPVHGVADIAQADRDKLELHDEPFLTEVLTVITRNPRTPPWGAYLARREDERVAGLCCFKADMTEGHVEIAYATLPSFEGRGVARSMVAVLAAIARAGGAKRLIAHTLPGSNASTRILERSGFLCEGDAMDPEDGLVWRWSRGLIEE
jgi:RimJ/RimL family protein N-acetyltransferase